MNDRPHAQDGVQHTLTYRRTLKHFFSVVAVLSALIGQGAFAATLPTVHVTIRDHTFIPKIVHVKPGQPIEWTNSDEDPHTITSGTTDSGDDRWKSSDLLSYGKTFTLQLVHPGAYPYFCKPHQFEESMHGTIVVGP